MARGSIIAVCVLMCACSESAQNSGADLPAKGDSIANTAAIVNLELVEDFRIGEVEGAWEKQFQNVRGVAFDRRGLIYVANGLPNEIRVFKTDGSFVKRFGRPGGGPGEFRQIIALRFMRDTLLIEDIGNGRLTTYTSDGRYVRTYLQYIKPHYVETIGYADGQYIAHAFAPSKRKWQEGEVHHDSTQVVALDSGGRDIVRQILKYPSRRLVGTRWAQSRGESASDWPLFDPMPHAAMDDSARIYVSAGAPYRIEVFDTRGTRLRTITREHAPVRIEQAHVDRYLTIAKERAVPPRLRSLNTAASTRRQLERHDERERQRQVQSFPPVARALIAPSGEVWVERGDLSDNGVTQELRSLYRSTDQASPAAWDLFDARGKYRGSVTTPESFYAFSVTPDRIVGVMRDDMDVEYVVGYRVAPKH